MNNYVMTFFNRDEKKWTSENTSHLSFSEAVREAYLKRVAMGHEWEITSVSKTQKDIFHDKFVEDAST